MVELLSNIDVCELITKKQKELNRPQPTKCVLDGIFFGEYFTGLRMIQANNKHKPQSIQPAITKALQLMKTAGVKPTVQTLDSLVSVLIEP